MRRAFLSVRSQLVEVAVSFERTEYIGCGPGQDSDVLQTTQEADWISKHDFHLNVKLTTFNAFQ